jgi:hypothetical protein
MTSQPRILLRRQPQVDTSPSLFDMHMATAGSNLDLATRGVPISGASGRFYRDFPSWLEVWAGRELSGNSGNHCAIASPSSHARATFTNIGVLAAVIVTRTFLSWSLTVEMEGRWHWQPPPTSHPEVVHERRKQRWTP